MNRVKFFRREPDGSVREAVVLVTQSNDAVKRGGERYRTVREAERELCPQGWTRKRLKPIAVAA